MNVAIVLSGGTGQRLGGDVPKQYLKVGGEPIIMYCLKTLQESPFIDKIQIVADSAWQDDISKWAADAEVSKLAGFSKPGENRQLSIYNGLLDVAKLAGDDGLVFIHDAARPNLSAEMIRASFEAVPGFDGVIPVLPMKDTVYLSKDGQAIDSLIDRATVFAGQAPETFVIGKYLAANQRLVDSGEIMDINGSTEPAIKAGMNIRMIPGDEANFKITTQADLDRFVELTKR